MLLNPYIAGNPVKGVGQFVGRRDIFKGVMQNLTNPHANALVLFGQRRIGKTSILKKLEEQLIEEDLFIPVYFDLQDKASLSLLDVLYQLAEYIARSLEIFLPSKELFDRDGIFFKDRFMKEACKKLGETQIVLLLDEFDVLDSPQNEQAGKDFFPFLRLWMNDIDHVKFIFIMGRRPEELSTDTLAAFKAIPTLRISLMEPDEARQIIRLSEKNKSLFWPKEAMARVFYWTCGHPYFTQLLCSILWENAYEELGEDTVEVAANIDYVDIAAEKALEQGANAFQWIWQGLPPAEQVIMAAIAEADDKGVDHETLTEILNQHHIRLILRELEIAPETLIKWDVLRPCDNGYCFAIPLMRVWVRREKPLSRVKVEMDSLEPLAENLYQSGEGFYNIGNMQEAEKQLVNALNVNPNHFRARLLLGNVLLGQGQVGEAVKEFEVAYKFDSISARPEMVKALLALAQQKTGDEQIRVYERILKINPHQAEALDQWSKFLEKKASSALNKGDLLKALEIYRELKNKEQIASLEKVLKRKELEEVMKKGMALKNEEKWQEVICLYEDFLKKYPLEKEIAEALDKARLLGSVVEEYNRALKFMKAGKKVEAQKLLLEILNIEASYKKAAWYFYCLVRGVDGNTTKEPGWVDKTLKTKKSRAVEKTVGQKWFPGMNKIRKKYLKK